MPRLLLKDLPRYECMLEASKTFPDLDPSAFEVYLYLLRASDEAFRVGAENFAKHNISPGRFMVLMALLKKSANCPECRTPAEMAERAGVTRATMTGLIDTLERDGLVVREPDPEDRRMMLVHLTPQGDKLIRQLLPPHFRRIASLMADLTENERRTLVRLLGKIVTQAASVDSRPPMEPTPTPAK